MTFAEILSSVYADCNYATSPATVVVTRIKQYVNDSVRLVLSEPGMARLQDSDAPFTVASVALQARYTLPESVAQIRGISERTNDRSLRQIDMPMYRRRNPDPASNSGVPTAYVPFGRTAVAVQPASALEIFVKSTAAGDTTQTAFVEGIITGGYQRTASVLLTGATAVSLSALITSWIEVTDFYLSAVPVGTVTLHSSSGIGPELARITIGATRPRYYGFYLDPTPSAAVDYLVDYRRQTVDLVQNTDEPPTPLDFHPMHAAYARMREYEKTQDDRYETAMAEWQRWLSRLKYAVNENADHLPVAGRPRPYGFSRLGGMYPNDTWRY
jgi:hypothetical protein